jgi:drug/metabolite transporter (DMT)-like permease
MILAVVGQIFLKNGILSSSLSSTFASIVKTLFSPLVFFGFFLYGVSSIIWLFVLRDFPLSIAAPTLSLSYVFIFIYSLLFLREPVTIFNYFGLLLIILGVLFINIK